MSGIFGGLLGRGISPEERAAWWEVIDIPRTNAGVSVTMDSALTMAAVFACVRILAEDVAKLPLLVYKRRKDGGKDRAVDHPLYEILHNAPNEEMTSYAWREGQQAWLGSWGNAYSIIRSNRGGQVVELWPLRSEWMQVNRDNGNLVYEYSVDGLQPKTYPASMILHTHGFGFDGIQGYSPIRLARQTIGLGMAAEGYGARFFANDARPGIVLKHPGKLSQGAADRLKEESEKFSGMGNQWKPRLLEEGLEIIEVGVPPEDAQFLQTRKFQVEEVARWFRMPPHKIQDLERSTNNNIEHQSIEYVVDTLLPWLTRWEQALTQKLLTERERSQGYFVAFLVDGLLRGDITSRYEAYTKARQWGWMSADDVRALENLNPLPGDQGKIYMVPLNMIPAESVGAGFGATEAQARQLSQPGERRTLHPEERAGQAARYRHKLMGAYKGTFKDAAGRVVRAEARDIRQQAQKMVGLHPDADFEQWLAAYYENHANFTADQFLPVLLSYAELVAEAVAQEGHAVEAQENIQRFMEVYGQGVGTRHSGRNLYTLQSKLAQARDGELDALAIIEETLDHWVENQPEMMAQEETVRSNNGLATMLYGMAGVLYLTWISLGKSCPYCSDLNGRVVGIQEYFLTAGSEYQPEGAEQPLTVNKSKRHPPAHAGCDCLVVAG